jgi:hypothetical protein
LEVKGIVSFELKSALVCVPKKMSEKREKRGKLPFEYHGLTSMDTPGLKSVTWATQIFIQIVTVTHWMPGKIERA